ncbi:hypothetical protein H6F67_19755 [Microcoleus sp. FACHB-1515]|uniref:hypothetical protein n=1 Tax=Cyanophyceae TaxID=3028117 RepID=UPI00168A24D7|nr:hypothetical protein [Microcoleus sp. FACHB-1515]MBD2092087.1 hypothetical protein [Microcoleus sp. FACHB-1515]
MVRKRNLSDLLRDEAGALDNSSDEPPAAEQTIDVSAEVADESAIEPTRRPHSPTKAELQAIVTDLTVESEALRDREQQLDHQIAELQAELKSRQTEIEQLQNQLQQQADQFKQQLDQAQQADQSAELVQVQQRLAAEQAQTAQLKTELEEAKQLILKLSEANSKPAAKAPETKAIDRPAPAPQRAPLQAKPLPQRGGAIAPARPPAPPARPAVQPRPFVPTRPIAPNNVPMMPSESDTRLSDADIGWVD